MRALLPAAIIASCLLAPALGGEVAKVNFQDHVLPVFRGSCLNCHNPDKKRGGLDLTTYAGTMAGSDGYKIVTPGDADDSALYRTIAHLDEPKMPMGGGKLPDKEIEIVRMWIAGGALETASGKPASSGKAAIDMAVTAPIGKPAQPSAMPRGLPSELLTKLHRPGPVSAMAGSPWAPLVAIGAPRQVVLFDTLSLQRVGVIPFPEGDVTSLRFSRSGNVLLAAGGSGARSGKVCLFDVATGRLMATVGEEFDTVLCADLRPDQSAVVLGTTGKLVKIHATGDGKLLAAIKKHTDWVTAIACSPDGKYLASGDRAGNLYAWEGRQGHLIHTLAGHKAGITALSFRDDGRFLASSSEDGTVKLWNLAEGTATKSINAHSGGATWVEFAHDGRLISTGRDRRARTWSAEGNALKAYEAFPDIALRAVFTHDAQRVIVGDFTGDLRVWSAADAKLAGRLRIVEPKQ